jgi:diguanylate cyclase
MHVRTEQMQARVAELEAQAKDLQGKLTDEQRLSMRDPLTDIANRLAYEKRIEEELKRWERFRQPTWIVVWDVDHFKRINDGYGHRAGDRVLRVVAERLASRMRTTDFIARYGGEEFVMILCGTQRDDAVRLIEEMRDGIFTLKFNSRGTPLAVTVSSGFTALQTGDSAAAAFDRADKALYQAKQTGRNRCVGL